MSTTRSWLGSSKSKKKNPKKSRRFYGRRPLLEALERREMLFADIQNLQLFDDTDMPGDLITSDPTVTGELAGDFMFGAELEFDHDADGSPDGWYSIMNPGESFTYDPRDNDPGLETFTGTFPLQVRAVEYDSSFMPMTPGAWEDFTFTLDTGGGAGGEIEVLDDSWMPISNGTTTIDFGQTSIGMPNTLDFTIQNLGESDLTLDASSLVLPTGFSVASGFDETVWAWDETYLSLQLDATTSGIFQGQVSFATNDADDNPFVFNIVGGVADAPGKQPMSALNLTPMPDVAETYQEQIGDGTDGDQDIDLYQLFLTAGQTLHLDIDAAMLDDGSQLSTLDSYVRVFANDGTELAANDAATASDDFDSSNDSYLSLPITADGTYFIGISGSPNQTYDAWTGSGQVAGSTGDYELTILVEDPVVQPPAEPSISISGPTVDEADGTATFTVTLSDSSTDTITVDYATLEGTATDGDDYWADFGTLTFFPGDPMSQTIDIDIEDDNIDEPNEFFHLQLSNPTNATLGTAQASATILDDDELQLPTLALTQTAVSVGEGDGQVDFTVTLSEPSTQTITVVYETVDDSALAGEDFEYVQDTIVFAPGATSVTLPFPIAILDDVDDPIGEPDETFTLVLSNPVNATGTPSATITIIDNDALPTLSFSAPTIIGEGTASDVVTVALSGPADTPVTVQYTMSGGSAVDGADYAGTTGTLTFPSGSTSQDITVSILEDSLDEDDETFDITLSSVSSNATIATATTTVSITDNDATPTVSMSATAISVDEESGTVTLQVVSSAVSGRDVTVDYVTGNGAATNGFDYTSTSGTLTIAAGVTSQQLTVPILSDTVDEGDEDFVVTLSSPNNATLTTAQTTVTILDDDQSSLPSLGFSDATVSVTEDGVSATITVTLSAVSADDVTVDVATSNSTAIAGADYTSKSETITIPAGQTSYDVTIDISDDPTDENAEEFHLTLSSPTNATIATPQATVSITDNDAGPTIEFSSSTVAVNEDAGTAFVTVTLTQASEREVSVNYATTAGTATADGDYTTTAGTLTFAPLETSKQIPISILEDTVDEASETLFIALSSPTNATATSADATVSITDNDAAPSVSLTPSSVTVDETITSVTLSVDLSVASEQTVTIDWATSDISATAGEDYTAASGTVTFLPGETTQQITLTLTDDSVDEINEEFSVSLSSPVNATVQGAATTITVTDDDAPAPTSDVPGDTFAAAMVVNLATASSVVIQEEIGNGLFDENDVDYFELVLDQGDVVTIDLDAHSLDDSSQLSTLDGYLRVLDANGVQLAANDNGFNTNDASFFDDGFGDVTVAETEYNTMAEQDAFISFVAPFTGTFYIALTGIASETDPWDEFAPETHIGAYELHLTREAPLPAIGLSVAAPDVEVTEGSSITFTVSLDSPATSPIDVNYRTRNGSAEPNVDYTPQSGTWSFLTGEQTKTVTVNVTNDSIWEADETVVLEVSGPSDVFELATATIHDDAADVNGGRFYQSDYYQRQVTIDNVRVIEGQSAEFVVTYHGGLPDGNFTVNYSTRHRSTNGADFIAETGSVTFVAGDQHKSIFIDTQQDWSREGEEQFFVDFTTPWGDSPIAAGTIVDPSLPVVEFSDIDVLEGDTTNLVLSLSHAVDVPITINYSTSTGSANANRDYTDTVDSITLSAGATEAVIPIDTTADWLKEADEFFYVQAATPWGYRAVSEVTIIDDRGNIPVVLFDGDVSVDEGDTAVLGVTLNKVFAEPVTVDVRSWASTASGCEFGYCEDFEDFVGTVTFQPGELHQTIDVETTADWNREPNEEVFFELSSTRGIHDVAMVTIIDEQLPTVSISSASASGGTDLVFTVTLSEELDRDATITYDGFGGSAYGGCSDYCDASGSLLFEAGDTVHTFSVSTTAMDLTFTYLDGDGNEVTEDIDIPDVHFFAHAYTPWNDFSVGTGTIHYSGAAPYTADPLPQLIAENDTLDIRHDLRPGADGDYSYEWYYYGYDGVVMGNDHYGSGGWWSDNWTASLFDDSGVRNGSLTFFPNGSFKYYPNPGFVGTESFQYAISDGVVSSNVATVTINVTNDDVDAIDDTFHVWHDTRDNWSGYGVLENDVDLDDLKAYLDPFGSVDHGTLQFFPNGKFLYTPDPGFTGTDSFNYIATDGTSFDSATVTIVVHNDLPVAEDDPDQDEFGGDPMEPAGTTSVTVWHDSFDNWSNFTVLANDFEQPFDFTSIEDMMYLSPEVDTLRASVVDQPQHGHVDLFANGYFNYTPKPGFVGPDSFTYRINDGAESSEPASVLIQVDNDLIDAHHDPIDINPPQTDGYSIWTYASPTLAEYAGDRSGFPVVNDDSTWTADLIVDGIGVLHNDLDQDALTATLASCAVGRVELATDGSFRYFAPPGFSGDDSFTYHVTDGAMTQTRTVTLSVSREDNPLVISHSASFESDLYSEHWLGNFRLDNTDGWWCGLVVPNQGPVPVEASLVGPDSGVGPLVFGSLVAVGTSYDPSVDEPTDYDWDPQTRSWRARYDGLDGDLSYDAWRSNYIDDWWNGVKADSSTLLSGARQSSVWYNGFETDFESHRFEYDASIDQFTFASTTFSPIQAGDPGWSDTIDDESGATWYTDGTDRFIEFYNTDTPSVTYYDVGLPTVTVNWGDSTASQIDYSVTDLKTLYHDFYYDPIHRRPYNSPGHLDIVAGHEYDTDGIYDVTISIAGLNHDIVGPNHDQRYFDPTVIESWTANVGSPVLAADAGLSLTATEATLFSGVVATFTDEDLVDVGPDYSAWIDWGDGVETYGTVSGSSGVFSVNGSHKYDNYGDYEVKVRLRDKDDTEATAFSLAPVANIIPTANDESFTTSHGHDLVVGTVHSVLNNDTDPGTTALIAQLVDPPQHGTVALNPDGSFVYDPDGTFVGDDTFTYQAHDGRDPSNLATVTITVTNQAAVAHHDDYDISHHTATTLELRSNDTDFDNDSLAVLIVDNPANGSVVIEPDGTVTYTPSGDYLGTDSFTYNLDDGFAIGNTATVTLNVKNDAPVLTHISDKTVDEETLLTFIASGSDVDLPADSQLNFSLVNPVDGMNIDPLSGVFTWTPTEVQGPQIHTATIRVTDNGAPALFDEQQINFTVREVNINPVGNNDSFTVDEGATNGILDSTESSLLANDTDADLPVNALSTPSVTVAPLHGIVILQNDGTFSYTHDGSETLADSFVYQINDGAGGTATATVDITVNPVNDAPITIDEEYVTAEDTVLTVPVAGVLDNDTDAEGDLLTAVIDQAPSNGAVQLATDGSFIYTPNPDFFGLDEFVYTVDDSNGGTNTATATIRVTAVNDAPTGIDDNATVEEDDVVFIDLLGNDINGPSNEDDQQRSFVSIGTPAHGQVNTAGGGMVIYTPDPDYFGNDSFTYTMQDDGFTDGSLARKTSLATAYITVTEVNDAPTADIDLLFTSEDPLGGFTFNISDLLANDTTGAPYENAQTITLITFGQPNAGTTVDNGDGTITYTPNEHFYGLDSFTYTIEDDGTTNGLADPLTIEGTVTVDVASVNDVPVSVDDTTYTTNEDTLLIIPTSGVLGNDSDVDGDSLTAILVTDVSNGSLTLSPDGSFEYSPNLDFFGTDTFSYVANDGLVDSAIASVTIAVNAINDAPTITSIADQSTDEDFPTTAVSFTVTDPESLADLTFTRTSSNTSLVANDSITITAVVDENDDAIPGVYEVTVDPAEHQFGETTITLTFSDPEGLTAQTSFLVTIAPVNDLPVGGTDDVTTDEDVPYVFSMGDFTFTDDDIGETLQQIRIDSLPASGDLWFEDAPVAVGDVFTSSQIENAELSYLNDLNENGLPYTDFEFSVHDGTEYATVSSTMIVDITAINDAPTITPITDVMTDEDFPTVAISFSVDDPESISILDESYLSITSSNTSLVAASEITFVNLGDGNFNFTIDPVEDKNGTAVISVTVQDPEGLTATSSFLLTVVAVNDAPTSSDHDITADEDLHYTFGIGDFPFDDEESDSLEAIRVSSLPASGTLWNDGSLASVGDELSATELANGLLTFVSEQDEHASGLAYTDFTFFVSDGTEFSAAPNTMTVIVHEVNDVPTTTGDDKSTPEDEPLTFDASDLAANDSPGPSNESSQTITVTAVGNPSSGDVELVGNSIIYTPAKDFNGTVTFTYTIEDNGTTSGSVVSQVATGIVTVDVTSVNDTPVATDNTHSVLEDGMLSVSSSLGALSGDSDIDGDPLTASLVTDVSNGTLQLNSDGSFVYTPNADFDGTDSFTYVANDGVIDSAPATVTINVTPINDAPEFSITFADQSVAEDSNPANISFSVSDIDSPVNSLVVMATSSNASLVPATLNLVNGDYELSVKPILDQNGTATITITVQDPAGLVTQESFVLTVNAVNDAPTILTNIADRTILEDQPLTVSFDISDIDSDVSQVTVAATSDNNVLLPSGGVTDSGTGTQRSITWIPATNESGQAVVTLTLTDTSGDSTSQSFTLTVDAVNDDPTINGLSATTVAEDPSSPVLIDFTVSDPDSSNPTVTATSSNTSLVPNDLNYISVAIVGGESRRLSLDPIEHAIGTSVITVTVTDTGGATVSESFLFTVTAVNDLPIIPSQQTVIATEDELYTFSISDFPFDDVETASLQAIQIDNLPSSGTLKINSVDVQAADLPLSVSATQLQSGDLQFIAALNAHGNSYATFNFKVSDGAELSPQSEILTIDVSDMNDPPILPVDSAATSEDNPITVDVLSTAAAGPSDEISQELTVTGFGNAHNGSVVENMNGKLIFTPASNFFGTTTFTYTVRDDGSSDGVFDPRSTTVTVTVDVSADNDAPVADDDSYSVQEDGSLNVSEPSGILQGDIDVESSPLTASLVTDVSNGTLQLNSDGSFTYTPNVDFDGVDTFTYRANDGLADSNVATVTIDVTPVNDAPQFNADLVDQTIDEDKLLTLTFSISDAETTPETPGGLSVTATASNTTLFGNGSLNLTPTGSGSYTLTAQPTLNRYGGSWIYVRVTDSEGLTTEDPFFLTVNSVNDPPVITTTLSDQSIAEDGQVTLTFNVEDVESSENSLVITGVAADGTLLPISGITSSDTTGPSRNITLKPAANEFGDTIVTLTITDPAGLSSTRSFNLAVTSQEDAPWISDIDAQFANEDLIRVINFSVGDADPDNTSIAVTASSSNTALVANDANKLSLTGSGENRTLTITPAADQNGQTDITITAIDDTGLVETETFRLTVYAVNDRPTSDNALVGTVEDTVYQFSLADFPYTDAEALPLRHLRIDNLPTVGTLSFLGEPVSPGETVSGAHLQHLSYTPALNQTDSATFGFSVGDGVLFSTTSSTMTIDITAVNDAPTISAITNQSVDEDMALGPIFFTIGDAESLTGDLTVTATSSLQSLVPNDNIILAGTDETRALYLTPAENQSGSTISIAINVTDEQGASVSQSFSLYVRPVNDLPTSDHGSVTAVEDTYFTFSPSDFSFTDIESIALNRIRIDSLPDQGVLQRYGINVSVGQTISVGDLSSGGLRFKADANESGLAYTLFTFRVSDGADYATESAAMLINVSAVNDRPTVSSSVVTTAEDTPYVLSLDDFSFFDADEEDALQEITLSFALPADTFRLDGNALSSSAVVSRDAIEAGRLQLHVRANDHGTGRASVWYFVSDGELRSAASARLELNITPVDDAPVAANDTFSLSEDTVLNVSSHFGILANDYDIEHDLFTAVAVQQPQHGQLTLYANGAFSYLPDDDFFGTDSFTYVANQSGLQSNEATVDITVTPVNDVPVAENKQFTVSTGNVLQGYVTRSDVDYASVTGIIVDDVNHGALQWSGEGIFHYTPNPGFVGTDVFQYYSLDDSSLRSATKTVTLNVIESQVGFALEARTSSGTLATAASVGDELILHVYAEDLRPGTSGLSAAYADVVFDANSVKITGTPHFDGDYKSERRADIRDGIIDNAGAMADDQSGVASGRELLYTIPFTIEQAGTITLTSAPAANHDDYDVLGFGSNERLDPAKLHYGDFSIDAHVRSSWQNSGNRFDVTDDGNVDVFDHVAIQNYLRDHANQPQPIDPDALAVLYYDVNGDYLISQLDIDDVLGHIAAGINAEGVGSTFAATESHTISATSEQTFEIHLEVGQRISARLLSLDRQERLANVHLSLIDPRGFIRSHYRHDELGNPTADFVAERRGIHELVVNNFGDNEIDYLLDRSPFIVVNQGTPTPFTLRDFASTNVANDDLESIEIAQLPSRGILTLNGTEVTPEQTVTRNQIENGELVFVPHAGDVETSYTEFFFSAFDGTTHHVGRMDVSILDTPADVRFRLEVEDSYGNVTNVASMFMNLTLNVYVEDLRSNSQGVSSAYLDLGFDPTIVAVNSAQAIVFGDDYPNGQSAEILDGMIRGIGASMAASSLSGEKLLFSIEFEGLAEGDPGFFARLTEDGPQTQSILQGSANVMQQAMADFEFPQITLTQSWQNPARWLDVSGDGAISAIDALMVINYLNDNSTSSPRILPTPSDDFAPAPFYDVDGDGEVSQHDAQLVVDSFYGGAVEPDGFGSDNVNQPPTANDDMAIVNEDLDITISVLNNDDDPENGLLSLQGYTDGAFGDVIQIGSQLRYTPEANFYGADLFTYTIVDDEGNTDQGTVTVQVNAVNDAPTISNIVDQFTDEDTEKIVSFTINDAESAGQDLIVSATSSNRNLLPNAGISITGSGGTRTLRLQPALDESGVAQVTVTVRDGSNSSQATSMTFELIVYAVNDAPTIGTINDLTLTAGTPKSIEFEVNDIDSARFLTLSAIPSHAILTDHNLDLTGSGTTRTVTIRPPAGVTTPTDVEISIIANDEFNASAVETFTVTIQPVTAATTNEYTLALTAVSDAYVFNYPQSSLNARNFGSSKTLSAVDYFELENGLPQLGYALESLVGFDLSGIEDAITHATLELHPSEIYGYGSGKIGTLFGNWSEQTVSWSSMPFYSSFGSWDAQQDVPLTIDVTAALQNDPEQVSFWLAGLGKNNGAKFHSRETRDSRYMPRLHLDLESTVPLRVPTPTTPSEPTLPNYQHELPDGSIVTVRSSNTNLVPHHGVSIRSHNEFRVSPVPGASGTSYITVTISNASQQPISETSLKYYADGTGWSGLETLNTIIYPPNAGPSFPSGAAAGWSVTLPTGIPIGLTPIATPGFGGCSTTLLGAVDDGPFMVGMSSADLASNDDVSGDLVVAGLPSHGKLFGDDGEELAAGDTFSTWSYIPDNQSADEGWHGVETWSYMVRESCEDGSTTDSNFATVTIYVPEVDMVIYHGGETPKVVEKSKEEVKDKLGTDGTVLRDANNHRIKVGEGAFTVANQNDTDNDGKVDWSNDDFELDGGKAALHGRDEIDLIKVELKKPSLFIDEPQMHFSVSLNSVMTGEGMGARVWNDKLRQIPADDVGSFTFEEGKSTREVWVELITPSVEIGDYQFSYGFMEGGSTDHASATAVWSSLTAVAHDRDTSKTFGASANELLNDPAWSEVNGGAERDLRKGIPPGLSTLPAPGYGLVNGIYQRWTVTPPRIQKYQHLVKVDIARQFEWATWIIFDGDEDFPAFVKQADFPPEPEGANDDNVSTDESDELTASDHFFVVDVPQRDTISASRRLDYYVDRYNFREFVRIEIGSRPTGTSPDGSRASGYFDWHARHYFKEFGGKYFRVPLNADRTRNYSENDFNDIGPGHKPIGGEEDWKPKPPDVNGG